MYDLSCVKQEILPQGTIFWVIQSMKCGLDRSSSPAKSGGLFRCDFRFERAFGLDRLDTGKGSACRRPYSQDLHLHEDHAWGADDFDTEGGGLLAAHARRTSRHSGKRETGDVRAFFEQGLDRLNGDMPLHNVTLHNVTLHNERVTATLSGRNAAFGFQRAKLIGLELDDLDLETVVLEVFCMAEAAAAPRR